MARSYMALNGPMPTTASQVAVTTGTAIKTLLQVAPPANCDLQVIEWGISFDGSTAATPGIIELCETDVAATVTAHVASGVPAQNREGLALASLVTLGTAATGYTATAEGTITAIRQLDVQEVAPTNQNFKQFPLGREAICRAGKFLRVRVKFAAAVNAIAYVIWEE